ncbi:ABC transporter ATP-binding protein [Sphingomonas ginkgonis]|uniref:ABC transporter ATP-binding protein n=1 Tax=Sphingomonas ginkgonis TaxID=2315330 RepID=A0A3R9X730_9SPHN|nr:ABC transporter ATP-binding protein [Sphingomonas ginkgonis]RST30383.1 ABC transporter ATP-binding protein [Sphingomonas ginkgonis]
MIRLRGINKTYGTHSGPVRVLRDVDLTIDCGERVGILGRNGAGKSTLIRLISGAEFPTSGQIDRDMSVSWPLAFGGAFQGSLTGLDNYRFICRIYGVDPTDRLQFVYDFSELGIYLNEPVKSYSSGMRARLAFAISMVIEFDCFLIDEIIAVGDARFHEKCHHELFEKRGNRAMIIVSHDSAYIREHCTRAAVLDGGALHHPASMEEAFDFYHEATHRVVAA